MAHHDATTHAMIEIKCPRCEVYWYSDDAEGGAVRLCTKCAEQLRGKRWTPPHFDAPFFIAAGLFLLVDAVLILPTALWPTVFGIPVLIYGLVLFVVGLRIMRYLMPGHARDADWTEVRWPALAVLAGLACIMAAVSFAFWRR